MSPEELAQQLNITVEQLLFCRRVAVTSCDRLFPIPFDDADSQTVWMIAYVLHICLNHLPVEAIAGCYRVDPDDSSMLASLKDVSIPCPQCLSHADLQALAYQILAVKARLNPAPATATESATEPATPATEPAIAA